MNRAHNIDFAISISNCATSTRNIDLAKSNSQHRSSKIELATSTSQHRSRDRFPNIDLEIVLMNSIRGSRSTQNSNAPKTSQGILFFNRSSSISNCYRKHEAEKRRAYEQRLLEVEHSTFTPLVFSATGGMAKQCSTFYKRLASLLANKWDHSYSSTLCWLRCRISFSLLRSTIQCVRGARSSTKNPERFTPPY